jgi:hypothetical protein
MHKEDEELLARVAKEKPELLDANVVEGHFHAVVGKLIETPPAPKQKRRKRRNARSKSAH